MFHLALAALAAPVLAPPCGSARVQPLPQVSESAATSLADVFPPETLVYVEAPGLSRLAEAGLEHPLLDTLLDSYLGALVLERSPVTPRGALDLAGLWLGAPVLPSLRSMTAHGVALGVVAPEDGDRAAVLLHARGDDPELARRVLDGVLARLADERGLDRRALARPHADLDGFATWFLGDDLTLALGGARLFVGNDEALLRDAVASLRDGDRPDPDGGSLAAAVAALRTAPAETVLARSHVDLARLEQADPQGLADLRRMVRDPGAQFLLGPTLAQLGAGRAASAALHLADDRVELELQAHGLPAGSARSLLPGPGDARVRELPETATDVAHAYVYRDLAALFRDRAALFDVDVLPKFAEAVSGLALLFGGEDVSERVLPHLSPWMQVVVRPPHFDAAATPDQPLPGAVLLATLDDAERVGSLLVGAFQTAIGLVNVDAAQQRRPPLTLSLSQVEGVQVTHARYPHPAADAGVDLRYNLVPACAVVGDTFVLATHASLVEDVVRSLRAPAGADADRPPREQLEASGAALADVVRANTEALAMQRVLEESETLEDARARVTGFASLLELLAALRITTDRPSEDSVRTRLVVEVRR